MSTELLYETIQIGLMYQRDGLRNTFRQHFRDDVVPLLSSLLKEVSHEIQREHNLVSVEQSDKKYQEVIHYTSIGVLVSMIQAQDTHINRVTVSSTDELNDEKKSIDESPPASSLRLYDTAHVNDPDEGTYFTRHLLPSEEHEWLKDSSTSHAYIASYIKPMTAPELASDNLVFWRAYGQEGEGCSIKFKIPVNQVLNVLYGPEPINATVQKLIPVREALAPLSNIDDSVIKQRIRNVFWGYLGTIQYLYKSSAYQYENECRFVVPASQVEPGAIMYEYILNRGSTGRLRHYCVRKELDITNILTSETEITIGPCVGDAYDLISSLRTLLRRATLYGPEVIRSEISYRKP